MIKKLVQFILNDELQSLRQEIKNIQDLCAQNAKNITDLKQEKKDSVDSIPLARKPKRPVKN